MPEYVRNFSEGLIDEERYMTLDNILAAWLENLAQHQYMIMCNPDTDEKLMISESDLERYDKNFSAFVERILQENQEESNYVINKDRQNVPCEEDKSMVTMVLDAYDGAFDDYSEESFSQNLFIKEMLDREAAQ